MNNDGQWKTCRQKGWARWKYTAALSSTSSTRRKWWLQYCQCTTPCCGRTKLTMTTLGWRILYTCEPGWLTASYYSNRKVCSVDWLLRYSMRGITSRSILQQPKTLIPTLVTHSPFHCWLSAPEWSSCRPALRTSKRTPLTALSRWLGCTWRTHSGRT